LTGFRGRRLNVVTLWYRAPELLLRAPHYGTPVDLWAAGCVVAEILRDGKPLLDGSSERDQVGKIIDALGAPSEATWPGVSQLPRVRDGGVALPHPRSASRFCTLNVRVPDAGVSGLDLLRSVLCYDPNLRATAGEALGHAWFDDAPKAAPLHLMPAFADADTSPPAAAPAPAVPRKRARPP
jgi:serine/threonine protein kinase